MSIRVGALISDIATATSRADQCNGIVQWCAITNRDVQNAARAADMSASSIHIVTMLMLSLVMYARLKAVEDSTQTAQHQIQCLTFSSYETTVWSTGSFKEFEV